MFIPQAAEAAASLGLAAKAQKRKAAGSVPLPKMATIGSSPILYTQSIVTTGENKRLLHALVFSKSILSCGKMLFLMLLLFIHSPTSSWKCLLGDDNCSCTSSAYREHSPTNASPAARTTSSCSTTSQRPGTDEQSTHRQNKETKEREGGCVCSCVFLAVCVWLFFLFLGDLLCCYSFIWLVFCFGVCLAFVLGLYCLVCSGVLFLLFFFRKWI